MDISIILEHLYLVFLSVLFSVVVGLPLGVLAYLNKPLRKIVLWVVEILQTIPALALLGLIMVIFGAGKVTVITGLVLYSLLPIVHNTFIGLENVDSGIKEAGKGMGLTKFDRLISVEIPLAFPMIFTGIRIATVTTIGVAVFATSVGGGGLGSIINQGIRTQNMKLILFGTLALMIMAIFFDFLMIWINNRLVKRTSN
ncbi:ABC transporter permease [Acetobacterium bakii]|uniref:Glycine/betaine ABC transporter permease n=1 Tax=Acetobacterium bakii TaxID=52689 RepID=A0A0L6TZ08_9FIRM|nr:ABC transporter permease [Acetobacterium bakii]KNZ41499.1 glycine/betaine ABC transporter permease [Acetobacterium bakii]